MRGLGWRHGSALTMHAAPQRVGKALQGTLEPDSTRADEKETRNGKCRLTVV